MQMVGNWFQSQRLELLISLFIPPLKPISHASKYHSQDAPIRSNLPSGERPKPLRAVRSEPASLAAPTVASPPFAGRLPECRPATRCGLEPIDEALKRGQMRSTAAPSAIRRRRSLRRPRRSGRKSSTTPTEGCSPAYLLQTRPCLKRRRSDELASFVTRRRRVDGLCVALDAGDVRRCPVAPIAPSNRHAGTTPGVMSRMSGPRSICIDFDSEQLRRPAGASVAVFRTACRPTIHRREVGRVPADPRFRLRPPAGRT